jgi:hypothetical protein
VEPRVLHRVKPSVDRVCIGFVRVGAFVVGGTYEARCMGQFMGLDCERWVPRDKRNKMHAVTYKS